MAYLNTFVDRDVEHPGRVNITPIDASLTTASIDGDGVASFSNSAEGLVADLTRAEGTVIEEGTPLNAQNINPIIRRLNLSSVGYAIAAGSNASFFGSSGVDFLMVWCAEGSGVSRGIDFIHFDDNGDPVVKSIAMNSEGSQLITYTAGGSYSFVAENGAKSTTVDLLAFRVEVTSV